MSNVIRTDENIHTALPEDELPIVWLTRDVRNGHADSLVDVWSARPGRLTSCDGAFRRTVYHEAAETRSLIGRFTAEQVRERFGIVPLGDECICIDNPKVN